MTHHPRPRPSLSTRLERADDWVCAILVAWLEGRHIRNEQRRAAREAAAEVRNDRG